MSKSINLLPRKSSGYIREKKIIRYLRLIAFLFLFALFISSLSFFFLNVQLSPERIKKQEDAVAAKFTPINERMVKLVFLKDRVKEIDGILKKRSSFEEKVQEIVQNVPSSNIALDSIDLNKTFVSMSFTSSSLRATEELLDTFLEMAKQKKLFKTLTVGGLNRGIDGKHQLVIQANLL